MMHVRINFMFLASLSVEAKRTIITHEANISQGGFVCPSQCQHCCTAHSWDIGIAAWGVSGERYKCVLKNKNNLPSGDCQEPEQRTHSTNQHKTQCPFTGDMGAKPWEDLKNSPCPKITSCCCDTSDGWSEQKCMDESSDRVTAASSHPKAKGKEQQYKKDYQRYRNSESCKGSVSAVEYQNSMKGSIGTHGKCCIERKFNKDTVKVPGSRRMTGGYFCDQDMCAADPKCDMMQMMCNQHEEWDYETVEWYSCKEFQTLHYCSDDDGVHGNGKHYYYRVPDGKGQCHPSDTCPSGFSTRLKDATSGRSLGSCKCDEACGR